MGEVADDMIEGRACELCGQYFENPTTGELYEHGYPVVCKDCWKDLSPEEKKERNKAQVNTL